MPVSKLVFIFVPVRELVWFPNSDWRVYLSFHSGSISAQTEILVWELGPSAQTGINESQFANWDCAHFGTNIYIFQMEMQKVTGTLDPARKI